jgi:hypothetical protein
LIESAANDALRSSKLLVDALTEERPLLEVSDGRESHEPDGGEHQQARDQPRAK